MKRGYSVLEYKSIVRRLRKVRPDISISSDFIVGFPGETAADFAATMKLIEEVGVRRELQLSSTARGRARPPRPWPTTRRTKRNSRGCSELQALLDAQAAAHQRGDGRHHAARAGRRRVARKTRAISRAAPTTIASSIFPARRGSSVNSSTSPLPPRCAHTLARRKPNSCTLETRRSRIHAGRQPASRQFVRRAG